MRAQTQVAKAAGKNLLQLLLERTAHPEHVAARQKKNGVWQDASWAQILEEVKKLSAALVAEGVKPGDRVAIFAGTSLQWVIADLAISAACAITIPIYASNTPDEVRYILNNSESAFLFVDNDESEGKQVGRASRVRQRLDQCPSVRKIFLFEGTPKSDKEGMLADLMTRGEAAHKANPSAFDDRVSSLSADDPALYIYTSGTTGDPKGVILTHGNWTYEAEAVRQDRRDDPEDSVLLFLPLAHSFAQVVKAAWLGLGFTMAFAESVDKLVANLAEIASRRSFPRCRACSRRSTTTWSQNGIVGARGEGQALPLGVQACSTQYVEAKQPGPGVQRRSRSRWRRSWSSPR